MFSLVTVQQKCETSYKKRSSVQGPVHLSWRNMKREVSLWNASNVFLHTSPEEWKTQQPPAILDLCLKKNWPDKPHDYCNAIVFSRISPFSKNVSPQHKNEVAFTNSSGLKSVFEKLRFQDGLVWAVGLTIGRKLRFKISSAHCGQDLTAPQEVTWASKNVECLKNAGFFYHLCIF